MAGRDLGLEQGQWLVIHSRALRASPEALGYQGELYSSKGDETRYPKRMSRCGALSQFWQEVAALGGWARFGDAIGISLLCLASRGLITAATMVGLEGWRRAGAATRVEIDAKARGRLWTKTQHSTGRQTKYGSMALERNPCQHWIRR
jgi:hypothetical protein